MGDKCWGVSNVCRRWLLETGGVALFHLRFDKLAITCPLALKRLELSLVLFVWLCLRDILSTRVYIVIYDHSQNNFDLQSPV